MSSNPGLANSIFYFFPPKNTQIEIANFHGKTVFDVAMSKLCVLMSWWPFMASKYLGKISKAKKGHSKAKSKLIIIAYIWYLWFSSKLGVLMSWWPFKASNYLGKMSKAKKGHSKVSKGQSKLITIVYIWYLWFSN